MKKYLTWACMCLVDSAPVKAASDDTMNASRGSSPASSLYPIRKASWSVRILANKFVQKKILANK
jgi:hypothetical protein